jgi:hypothetical protein
VQAVAEVSQGPETVPAGTQRHPAHQVPDVLGNRPMAIRVRDGPLPGPLEDQDPLGPAGDGPDETHRSPRADHALPRHPRSASRPMTVARSPHRRHAPGAARPRSRHHLRDQPRAAPPDGARPPGTQASPVGDPRPDRPGRPRRTADHHARRPPAYPNRIPATAPGLTHSGQPGSPQNAYRHHGPDAGSIIRAALDHAS